MWHKICNFIQISVHFLQLLHCHFELLLFNMVKIIPIGVTRIVGRFSYFFLLELQKENLQEKKNIQWFEFSYCSTWVALTLNI